MTDGPADKRTEFLTARQLAEYLQVSETTVHRLRRRGLIPSVKLTDRIVRFNLKDVRSALTRNASRKAEREPPDDPRDDGAQLGFADLLPEFEASNQ